MQLDRLPIGSCRSCGRLVWDDIPHVCDEPDVVPMSSPAPCPPESEDEANRRMVTPPSREMREFEKRLNGRF
jgi:hypothetical protein